jgi:hypothetical protein
MAVNSSVFIFKMSLSCTHFVNSFSGHRILSQQMFYFPYFKDVNKYLLDFIGLDNKSIFLC